MCQNAPAPFVTFPTIQSGRRRSSRMAGVKQASRDCTSARVPICRGGAVESGRPPRLVRAEPRYESPLPTPDGEVDMHTILRLPLSPFPFPSRDPARSCVRIRLGFELGACEIGSDTHSLRRCIKSAATRRSLCLSSPRSRQHVPQPDTPHTQQESSARPRRWASFDGWDGRRRLIETNGAQARRRPGGMDPDVRGWFV